MMFHKQVEVKRNGYDPVMMEVKINDKNFYLKIEGELYFIDVCKYLIENTPLLNIDYNRICPYKLEIKKVHNNDGFSHKEYKLKYLEIKSNYLLEKEKHILNLYGCNMKVQGEMELFIPDLLLVMEERGYISKQNERKYIPARKFNLDIEYKEMIPIKSPEELKAMGYHVPEKYNELYPYIKEYSPVYGSFGVCL
jgi:hypothetical protein